VFRAHNMSISCSLN